MMYTLDDTFPRPNRNFIGNGLTRHWSRGTAPTVTSGVVGNALDLWKHYRNNSNGAVSRQAGFSGASYCVRAGKTGGAGTQAIILSHQFDSDEMQALANQVVSFSCDARRGSSYDGTGVTFNLASSPVEDDVFNLATAAFGTGPTTSVAIAATGTLSTTAAKHAPAPVAIPSDCKSLALRAVVNLAATTGDSNYYAEITNWRLERGPKVTPFEPMAAILSEIACQRRVQKSFARDTAPAQNVGALSGEYRWRAVAAGAVEHSATIRFAEAMRVAPTITLYNPAAASAEVRDISGGANCTASGTRNVTPFGFEVYCTGHGALAANALLGVHWLAEAGY